MTQLPIKPGIDGIPTGLIPTDPAAFVDWFKNSFLPRWAANADARNAIPTSSSVVITGDTNTPAGIGIGANSITNAELVKRSPLSVMGNPTAVQANAQDIAAGADNLALQRVAGALVWAPVVPTITVADSITGTGAVLSPLELVNDSASPGNSQYYGTDQAGAKGFHPITGSSVTTLVQTGGASQSYPVPTNATTIEVICIAGGGGGGSGIFLASTASASGGAGGGGGAISYATFRAADLGPSVTVAFSNVATGGNGGASKNAVGAGNSGVNGSNVQFGNYIQASGGIGGGPGLSATGSVPGTGGATGNYTVGTTGGAGHPTTAASAGGPPVSAFLTPCMGGGGGGGIQNPGVAALAGIGGQSTYATPNASNIAGGTVGGAGSSGGTGGSGSGTTGGGGGGGGAGAITGTAGVGGTGGQFGGGGGGGGNALSPATASGAGGQGGLAVCIVVAF